jgi:hypothetical protein
MLCESIMESGPLEAAGPIVLGQMTLGDFVIERQAFNILPRTCAINILTRLLQSTHLVVILLTL